jgi:hypothetical protein
MDVYYDNTIEFSSSESRAAYKRKYDEIRRDTCIDTNKRLASIFKRINPKWENRAIFTSPITTSVLNDYNEQWTTNRDFPLNIDPKNDVQALGRFNWYQNIDFHTELASQFNVAVYAGKKLIALSMGGHQNWHGTPNGEDHKTNVVGIDTAEVGLNANASEPGLALIAIAETARSFGRHTDRDILALVQPSDRVKALLDKVHFPKSEQGDYIANIEDLDKVWENLHDKLFGKEHKIGTLPKPEVNTAIAQILSIPGNI